jgi:hypothetical protein
MTIILGMIIGFIAWFLVRYLLAGPLYSRSKRAGRQNHLWASGAYPNVSTLDDPIAEHLREEEKERYKYPQVRVIMPGGPYFKWPWERIYKVSIATQTVNMAHDPENPAVNQGGQVLEAVTKGPTEHWPEWPDSLSYLRT